MLKTPVHLNFASAVSLMLMPPNAVFAAEHGASMGYFEGRDLDFWGEGKLVKPFSPRIGSKSEEREGTSIRERDTEPFSWEKYQSPKNIEFWDDGGDYVPPRPFREAAANPTQENLNKYLAWQADKMAVVAKFQDALSKHQEPKAKKNAAIMWNELELIYFYQTSCPHCQVSVPLLATLQQKGVKARFVQLDAGTNPPLHKGSVPYTQKMEVQFHVNSTPTWVFRRKGKSLTLTGEQQIGGLEGNLAALF